MGGLTPYLISDYSITLCMPILIMCNNNQVVHMYLRCSYIPGMYLYHFHLVPCPIPSGIGLGLQLVPSIVIVGYYFDRRRALATGIACSGAGVGMLLFAFFVHYLLSVYSWKESVLILAALSLHGAVMGCLMRPLHMNLVWRELGEPIHGELVKHNYFIYFSILYLEIIVYCLKMCSYNINMFSHLKLLLLIH